MRQLQPAAEQHCRPDDGVVGDVVLGHEVAVLRLGVIPPFAPRLVVALQLCPVA